MDEAKNIALKSLIKSKNKNDKQFINMHKIRQAKLHGVKLGFKGFTKGKDLDNKEEFKQQKDEDTWNQSNFMMDEYSNLANKETQEIMERFKRVVRDRAKVLPKQNESI